MSKTVIVLSVISIFLLSVSAGAAPDHPAAILLSFSGDVTVIKNSGELISGSFGLGLVAGDRVKTGKNSEAEIHFEDGTWIEIGPNSTMQVKASRVEEASHTDIGKDGFKVVQNFLKLKNAKGTSSIAALRSVEKEIELRAISPGQTRIRTLNPLFRWDPPDQETELLLVLYSDEGIVWKEKVRGSDRIEYPSGAPRLNRGESYSWTLETTDPLMFPPLRSKANFFEIISEEENSEIETALGRIILDQLPGKASYHIIRASLLFDHGLTEEAIAETIMATGEDPGNMALHSILARLYTEVGSTEEALAEYDRILEIH
ncbi:MAG: FecR domain-containing protein [Candidatus Krumholzibacteriota bacterium]|nr:FecR domain-containing protein [Candidatus Krumholzibacteriota bacterium]